MQGRHRKPPKYEKAAHYIGNASLWLLLVALFFLMFLLLKDLL